MAQRPLIYTVPLLNQAVAGALRGIGLGGRVLVKGEIADVSVRSSRFGLPMVFFSLREGDEALSCISYGRDLNLLLTRDTQTGEVFRGRKIGDVLVEARRVLLEGVLGTYTRNGRSSYRLMVNSVTDIGEGELLRRLRVLRDRLAKLGFFARDRGLGCHIEFYQVKVQGIGAGAEIAEAVQKANARGTAQVIVIIRGGGSADDLACFNEEIVAKAIFSSKLPVLTGIGHEVDHTLAEMTADVGASTPTKAAQLLWTPRSEILAGVAALQTRAAEAFGSLVAGRGAALAHESDVLRLLSPAGRLRRMSGELAGLVSLLARRGKRLVRERELEAGSLTGLARSAFRQRIAAGTGAVLDCSARLPALSGRLSAGAGRELARETSDLVRLGRAFFERKSHGLEALDLRLGAVSPLRPLERGFALVRDEKGHIVRGTAALSAGAKVRVSMADGSFGATVDDVSPAPVRKK